MVDLLCLVEELLIEEGGLEGIIKSVRDFNVDARVLREDKHVVRGHKSPEKGNSNKELIEKFNFINKTYLDSKDLSLYKIHLREPLPYFLKINFTSDWEEIYIVI